MVGRFIWIYFGIFYIVDSECPFGFRSKRHVFSQPSLITIEKKLYSNYIESLYTNGQDEETKLRGFPSRKNNFGHCTNDICNSNNRYRTLNGFCNNLVTDVTFGRSAVILNRLMPPKYDDDKIEAPNR